MGINGYISSRYFQPGMGKSSRNTSSNDYCKHLTNLDLEVLHELAESGKEIRCSDCDEQGRPQQKYV